MVYLVDTNVLLRVAPRGDPHCTVVRAALRKLHAGGHRFRAAAQNYVEFWNVTTRPVARNGFGFAPAAADRRLHRIEQLFPILPAAAAVYPEGWRLVVAYGISGIQVHDAHLVAVMSVHGIQHILTLNLADFTRYTPHGIVAVDPRTV